MKELTFREVIANIKDGEIWENEKQRVARIYINKLGNVQLEGDDIDFAQNFSTCVDLNAKYKLKRKKYSFTEAFKAYEEGKEIESRYGGQKLKKENEKDYCFDYEKGKYVPLSFDETFFDITNIRSEWYIND